MLPLPGCTYGFLYTDITTPVVVNMHDTKTMASSGSGKSTTIKDPITAAGLRVEWSTYGIGDVGKINQSKELHYADLRYQSYLGGLFQYRKIKVYGVFPQVVADDNVKNDD